LPVIDHGYTKTELENIFTIGWIGYYGAYRQSLTTLFFPALYDIQFPIKLKLLGEANEGEVQEIKTYFKQNKNISVETPLDLDWHNEHSIYYLIKTFDIGVAPLMDTEFNRGKSAFKLKLWLSWKVPALGSSVGENNGFLIDGVNGYFCDNRNDYFQKISKIKTDSHQNFLKLSINSKNSFEAYSIDNYCSTLINHYKLIYHTFAK